MSLDGLERCRAKMRAAGIAEEAIASFAYYYRQLESGRRGLIAERDIEPVPDLPALDDLPSDPGAEAAALRRCAVIKLNGGLGTSMGVSGPKSALQVTAGLSFLDIAVRQVLAARQRHRVALPLIWMNSFRTRDATLAALRGYPELGVDKIPPDIVQNAEPKLRADDLTPIDWPADPELEWCPPGHGDVYVAMVASGVLASLREHGYRYAFISNADNLGAIPDGRIAVWMAANQVPFGMEVCRRTVRDRKGGHLAVRRADGRLILRESAQTDDRDTDSFADITRHTTFNTNTAWVDLEALQAVLDERAGLLGLPMIVNRKLVDPADPGTPPILQLETAMGAAIEVFDGARAVVVGRDRFRPVKTTDDLLVVRSDLYDLDESGALVATAPEPESLDVNLDAEFFGLVDDFEARFPDGVPSLRAAARFEVRGDVTFGRGVMVVGDVTVEAPDGERRRIGDGVRLGP